MGEWGKPRAEAQQWLLRLRLRLSGRAPGLPTVIQTGVSQEDSLSAPGPATGTARRRALSGAVRSRGPGRAFSQPKLTEATVTGTASGALCGLADPS